MPIYESACTRKGCPAYERPREWFTQVSSDPDPACPECGKRMKRCVSIFQMPFVGELRDKYGTKDNGEKGPAVHTMERLRSKKHGPEVRETVVIDSFDKQKQFCRDEGLVNPTELPRQMEMASDGKRLSSRGMPGSWI